MREELVGALASHAMPLSHGLDALRTALVRAGVREAIEWLEREMMGYSYEEEVPEYRRSHARVIGEVLVGGMRVDWGQDVTELLPVEQMETMTTKEWREPVGALETVNPNEPVICEIIGHVNATLNAREGIIKTEQHVHVANARMRCSPAAGV